MKKKFRMLIIFFITINFMGCSAVMAAKGKREANISALQIGDSKNVVVSKIGYQPIRSTIDGNKQIEIYEIEIGNEPSAGRAIAHGTMDILTLGLWEIVGTPIEATTGEKSYLTIEYIDGKLINFHQTSKLQN